jgi:hypothetical protein
MSLDDRIFAANERNHEMETKKEFLQKLVDNEDLDGTAHRIAEVVIANGEDGLTPKQKLVFERYVIRVFAKPCKGCDCNIPWEDKYEAYHEWDGVCFDCHDGMTKDRDE